MRPFFTRSPPSFRDDFTHARHLTRDRMPTPSCADHYPLRQTILGPCPSRMILQRDLPLPRGTLTPPVRGNSSPTLHPRCPLSSFNDSRVSRPNPILIPQLKNSIFCVGQTRFLFLEDEEVLEIWGSCGQASYKWVMTGSALIPQNRILFAAAFFSVNGALHSPEFFLFALKVM